MINRNFVFSGENHEKAQIKKYSFPRFSFIMLLSLPGPDICRDSFLNDKK
jgi:hypothetical protein